MAQREGKETSRQLSLVVDYAWQQKKRGLAESTIKQMVYRLKQLAKEGTDLASKIQWADIDEKSCSIKINNQVKGNLARIIKVTPKTIAMLNALPKTGNYVFSTHSQNIRNNFEKQRKRIAMKLQNPRLKQIHLL